VREPRPNERIGGSTDQRVASVSSRSKNLKTNADGFLRCFVSSMLPLPHGRVNSTVSVRHEVA
jgi:hypothetical protein